MADVLTLFRYEGVVFYKSRQEQPSQDKAWEQTGTWKTSWNKS